MRSLHASHDTSATNVRSYCAPLSALCVSMGTASRIACVLGGHDAYGRCVRLHRRLHGLVSRSALSNELNGTKVRFFLRSLRRRSCTMDILRSSSVSNPHLWHSRRAHATPRLQPYWPHQLTTPPTLAPSLIIRSPGSKSLSTIHAPPRPTRSPSRSPVLPRHRLPLRAHWFARRTFVGSGARHAAVWLGRCGLRVDVEATPYIVFDSATDLGLALDQPLPLWPTLSSLPLCLVLPMTHFAMARQQLRPVRDGF